MTTIKKIAVNKGFTLIEVLIATLILAVGLLGLSGMQAMGLRSTVSSYNRSQATQLTYDMIDRIRSTYLASDSHNVYVTIQPENASEQPVCISTSDSCSSPTACDSTKMAEQHLFEWNRDLKAILPSGKGTITSVATSASIVFTITVSWDDNRDGIIDADDPNFQMGFREIL